MSSASRTKRGILLAVTLLITIASAGTAQTDRSDFRAAMRKLWEDHITWTRLYLVAAAANLPEKPATATRLMQNQVDIGNAIKPYYADVAGTQLTALLKDHITIAVEIIDDAMQGNTAKKNAAVARWSKNADGIAQLLSAANPKQWPLADMTKMVHSHIDLTTAEVTAHLEKRWVDDVAAYDKVHDEILQMADALSAGIIAQFPAKFKP